MHDMWGHMEGWGGYWLMGLVCLLVVVGLVLLIVWAFRAPGSKRAGEGAPPSAESPLEILKKRYAQGELSDEEFEEKKRRLTQ